MIRKISVYVLDSSALICLFKNEKEGKFIEKILRQAENKEVILHLPVMQYGEILYITEREFGLEKKNEVEDILENLPIQIVAVDKKLSKAAASFKSQGGIAYPDCFVIAIAIKLKATILTKDKEFKKFENKVDIRWCV